MEDQRPLLIVAMNKEGGEGYAKYLFGDDCISSGRVVVTTHDEPLVDNRNRGVLYTPQALTFLELLTAHYINKLIDVANGYSRTSSTLIDAMAFANIREHMNAVIHNEISQGNPLESDYFDSPE